MENVGSSRGSDQRSLAERARGVFDAETDDFVELIGIAGLNPFRGDLRFSNWSNISFEGCDLRRFDFSGARLTGCSFKNALIDGARFDGADLRETNLGTAKDWNEFSRTWTPLSKPMGCGHLNNGAMLQDAPFAPEMIVIPPGSFFMGSPDGSGGDQGEVAEWGRTRDEGRRRRVEVETRFALGRFAVTVDQFAYFVASTEHKAPTAMETHEYRKTEYRPGRDWQTPGFKQTGDHPVVGVRWIDAVAYCDWLSDFLGQEYRLPSEVEWEYAARAGTDTPFWWGDTIDNSKACYDGTQKNGPRRERIYGWEATSTEPVQRYEPSPWGLYQVHGNVWEWCDNSYVSATHRSLTSKRDPDLKSIRGGSWKTLGRNCRSANRSWADKHQSHIGFRVLRSL